GRSTARPLFFARTPFTSAGIATMSTSSQEQTDIYQAADQLLAQARHALGDMDRFYRDQGLDPDRVRSVMTAFTSPEMQAEAAAQFNQVCREVEQEVEQKLSALINAPGSQANKAAKLRRGMV